MTNDPSQLVKKALTALPASTLVETLRRQITQIETGHRSGGETVVSCGCDNLDHFLPDEGFRRGSLVEWLADQNTADADCLTLIVAREACRDGGMLVVFDSLRQFYPPAAVRLGIDPARLLVVQPADAAEKLWALDQVLRSQGVAAAVARLDRVGSHDFRRLQLAAESQKVLGLLLRPPQARGEPSWAEVRLQIESLPSTQTRDARRFKVELLRSRRGVGRGTIEVEINEETHPVCLVARLARAEATSRPGRAV